MVLELGFFIGSLGRHNVCVLLEDGVEIPSDIIGVGYIHWDEAGDWPLKLAQEMKRAGVDLDLNDLV